MLKMLEGDMIVRSDSMGDGHYLAPRGSRKHYGVDYVVVPGENILMPFPGEMLREARPYADSDLSGCVLQGTHCCLKIFYLKPFLHLVGRKLPAGTVIGLADDVRRKYGSRMVPHIHCQVEHFNVDKLFGI